MTSSGTDAPGGDEVVLRQGQWLSETDEPVDRKFLLLPALPAWQAMRSAQWEAATAFLGPPNPSWEVAVQRQQWDGLVRRLLHSRWVDEVLEALRVPYVSRVTAAEVATEYMPAVYRLAQEDARVGQETQEALLILDRAFALASARGNSASEFARHGPVPAVLVATAALSQERKGCLAPSPGETPPPVPAPLAAMISTASGRSTRGWRGTQRALLAQLAAWKQECQHVPHLWFDGRPSTVGGEACFAPMAGAGGDGGGTRQATPEEEPGEWDADERKARAAEATFHRRLLDQTCWRQQILKLSAL